MKKFGHELMITISAYANNNNKLALINIKIGATKY